MTRLTKIYLFFLFNFIFLFSNLKKAHGLDFIGEEVRAMAMGGALRSQAFSTSALLLNPGGIALLKLYHIDGIYRFDHPFQSHLVGASIVDSITSVVGVGIGYFYRRIEQKEMKMQMHDARLSIAIPIANILGIGITGKYLNTDNRMKIDPDIQSPPFGRELNSFSLDAGAEVKIGNHVGIGVAGYNLTYINTPAAPISLGFGASLTWGNFLVQADGLLDWTTYERLAGKVMGGIEYFVSGRIPLRLGYSYSDGEKVHTISGGLGYISKIASIEASVAGDINEPLNSERNISFMISIKYFLNSQ